MKLRQGALIATAVVVLAGCSSMTLNTARQSGSTQLKASDIFNLVSGNTLKLSAYDFDGTVYFSVQGGMAGLDNEAQKDTGRWDIKDTDQLCLKFQNWYYGDLRCYFVALDRERNLISFFTSNGAAYYSGSVSEGDTLDLEPQIKSKKPSSFIRSTLAGESSVPGEPREAAEAVTDQSGTAGKSLAIEASSTLRQLAQKCNDCNLSGADLKEAVLVKAELERADLSGADLRYANLRRARLAGANLSGAKLNHANLPGADLRGCDLRGADLSGANLLLADFTGADLTGADLTNAHIENTIGIAR